MRTEVERLAKSAVSCSGALALALLVLTGCQGSTGAGATADNARSPGCGLVDPQSVTGLLGPHVVGSLHGSLRALREQGKPVECTSTVTGHPDRSLRIRADRHPSPMSLPHLSCDQGWVYAGSPAKYTPACQQSVGEGGRTLLFARWGQYVVRVTVRRSDRSWGGDPEAALKLSHQVASRLNRS